MLSCCQYLLGQKSKYVTLLFDLGRGIYYWGDKYDFYTSEEGNITKYVRYMEKLPLS